jgi:GTPase
VSRKPVVSIIGRPNVGKSTLFNRIIGKRVAVVDDKPGVTRDRNYFTTEWNGKEIILVDTGGMLPGDRKSIPEAIHEQVRMAIGESVAVLFIVDATTGPTDLDLQIAQTIRRASSNKVICVVNKAESRRRLYEIDKFRSLGLGEVYGVSALHGNGVADILDMVVWKIEEADAAIEATDETGKDSAFLRLAIVGRPNAGKSSLVNMLLNKRRMIVDNQPGTTRDAIDSTLVWNDKKIVLIDTAGLRKKSHVKEGMEYFSNLRALDSIERCNICVLMVDVTVGIGVQDLRILKRILDMRKGVLLGWNKWDLKKKDHRTFDELVVETRRQFKELQFIPMVSLSALSGQRAATVLEIAGAIKERMAVRVGNAEFENNLFNWVRRHPHPAIPENPVRFLGAKQVNAPFPLFRFFVSNPKGVAPAYYRYLLNKIHETYDFEGCPVVLDFKPAKRPKRRRFNQFQEDEE